MSDAVLSEVLFWNWVFLVASIFVLPLVLFWPSKLPNKDRTATCHHVIPVGGSEPLHIVSESCWCHPLKGADGIIVHNAKDTRERFERQGLTHPDKKWVLVLVLESKRLARQINQTHKDTAK
jgi:hypothetical protein